MFSHNYVKISVDEWDSIRRKFHELEEENSKLRKYKENDDLIYFHECNSSKMKVEVTKLKESLYVAEKNTKNVRVSVTKRKRSI